mmetsp:Transcript_83372/g.131645  ORF Transcript_83372/g.131645 Transcript_83372/m.131645 type:complete len:156 (-) Transcript_83372:177-644(-)
MPITSKPISQTNEDEEEEEFDVTNYIEFVCGCCMTKKLYVETEYVRVQSQNICSASTVRVPYGEIGDVTVASSCGCCSSFNLTNNPEGAISPGLCGCDRESVQEIVDVIKARTHDRGDAGQVRRLERIEAKLDLICSKMAIDTAAIGKPAQMNMH